jgi:hypothetical protein
MVHFLFYCFGVLTHRTPNLLKTISLFLRLPIVRIFPKAVVHTKKATFKVPCNINVYCFNILQLIRYPYFSCALPCKFSVNLLKIKYNKLRLEFQVLKSLKSDSRDYDTFSLKEMEALTFDK